MNRVESSSNAVATSKGLFAYHRSTNANYTVTVRTKDGTGSGWAGGEHNDWNQLDIAGLSQRAMVAALTRGARDSALNVARRLARRRRVWVLLKVPGDEQASGGDETGQSDPLGGELGADATGIAHGECDDRFVQLRLLRDCSRGYLRPGAEATS